LNEGSSGPSRPVAGVSQTAYAVDAVAKVVALGVVPALVGALHRAIAFFLSGRVPAEVGVDLSVPQLALLGFALTLPGVVVGSAFVLYFRTPPKAPTPQLQEWARHRLGPFVVAHSKTVQILVFALMVTLVVFGMPPVWSALITSNGPGTLLSNLVGFGVIAWGLRLGRAGPTVSFRRLLPLLGVMTVAVAGTSTIGPTTAGTLIGDLHLAPESNLPDGKYTILGETDTETWLLSCVAGASVVRVPTTSVLSMRVVPFSSPPPVPTIAESLRTGRWVAGFTQQCP
jgi:hypothetical protein